jgi:DNA-directed RNA polymerase subunit beta
MDLIEKMESIVERCSQRVSQIREHFGERIERLGMGDELAPGVIKMVKVYVAVKRKLSVGDKMAGRHGNKGVLSRILPVEDMPYFSDGTPVDIILNPLGVPSRMNVGQVLEAHLGWASHELGVQVGQLLDNLSDIGPLKKKLNDTYSKEEFSSHFNPLSDEEVIEKAKLLTNGLHMASPVFDGASEEEIKRCLKRQDCQYPVRRRSMTVERGRPSTSR